MIFGSNPSVYTLPGTWEAQPMVPVELIFSTTIAIATLGVIAGLTTCSAETFINSNEFDW